MCIAGEGYRSENDTDAERIVARSEDESSILKVMRRRGMALKTERSYIHAYRSFVRQSEVTRGNEIRAEHLKSYLDYMAMERAENQSGVHMPGALDKKMPKAGCSWQWFWLFPMQSLSRDPRGAADAPKRRHHVLPRAYQKELSIAAAKAGTPKRSNSHVLRHSYATHLLESGTNIRTLQEFLGHACVGTMMIYLHVMEDQADRVRSPLDTL